MDEVDQSSLNFIKLEGKRVEDGKITIADIKNVLSGIEKTTKYFINSEHPDLAKSNYEIEVKVESGSLTAYLVGLLLTGGTIVTTAYLASAATQLGKNDVGDKTTKDVLGSAVRKMKSTAKIAKHMGTMAKHQFQPEETKITGADNIVIISPTGAEMTVTKDELDIYAKAPKDIFKKMTSIVDKDTKLFIGEAGETETSPSIMTIDASSKPFFGSTDETADDVLFPEWQHGETLTLKGELRRANTNTGTLGFFYNNHTITSSLVGLEIKNIKDSLFDKEVEIVANVVRIQKKLDADDDLKKPKLEIKKVKTIGDIDKKPETIQLFGADLAAETS